MSLHAAVDLGASSGRVVLGRVEPDRLALQEVHRFWNGGVPVGSALHWDVLGLWRQVLHGLGMAERTALADHGSPVATVGVDSWAVDYGLIAADQTLLGNPRHYRDSRTDGVAEDVHARLLRPDELYRCNGLQHLPFTTLYQLVAEHRGPLLAQADRLLLVPDLLNLWLCGHVGAEATNVSTTGLAHVRTGTWDPDLAALVDVPLSLLPPVHQPGAVLGGLLPGVRTATGLAATARVTAVGSHDTASAVLAVPAQSECFAYISCGTWGLVGVELEEPVLTEDSRLANFTNERGVDDRVRYLRNVMGLWVLTQCLAEWESKGRPQDLERLLAAAGELPRRTVVDVDDPALSPPGPMVARLQRLAEASGQGLPEEPAVVVRCVLDSLADAFARAVRDAARLSGRDVDVVHLVGGGARNALLCQLTANACGLPVDAGPVEATALGNLLVQARSAGTVRGSVEDLRALVASTHAVRRYEPLADVS